MKFVLFLFTVAAYAQVLPQGPRNILTYSTYLGGGSNDTVHAMAIDSQGNVYLAGETVSPDFPVTPGALQPKHGGKPGNDCSIFTGCYVSDAFVTKFDSAGKIVYSTYLGGTGLDIASGIAVDAAGNVYVAGVTASPNFPVTPGAFQTTPRNQSAHAFVAKLNPSGTALVYSTLIGGSGAENTLAGIRIDAAGNAYVAGITTSLDFPVTPGAFQTNVSGTREHSFVFKLNAAGSALTYATYLSGSKGATAQSMALTSAGEVLVTGATTSSDFPVTPGAYQGTLPGGGARFVTRLNPNGSGLVYSTFLGGPGNSTYAGIDIDKTGAAYVTGDTLSPFPATPGAFTGPASAAQNASTVYAAKLSPDGSRLIYAALLYTGVGTLPGPVTVDAGGNAYVTGRTNASNFPVTPNAYQSGYSASACFGGLIGPFAGSGDIVNCGDAYLTELDATGSKLLYSTYFGSNGGDGAEAVAIAPDGSFYLAGTTQSALLPATASAPQTHRALGPDCTQEASPSAYGSNICSDVFLARFHPDAPAAVLPFEVVNGASFLPGAIAPGELVTLFGPGIGSAGASNVRVLFDQTSAPLLYAGTNQINVVVPYDTASKNHVLVTIETNGVAGPGQSIEMALVSPASPVVAPGVFTADASGFGQAAAFNNPDGSFAIYVTGLGVTDIAVADGTITGPTLLPRNIGTIEVFVGGQKAQVLYAGAAPGIVAGVSQVNFVVPSGVAPGNQPIFVSAGHTESSQSGVWITVK